MTRAETAVEIHDLIAERRSPRSLDETAEITKEDLLGILEAARWAPSANNFQPWQFVAGKRGEAVDAAGGHVFPHRLPGLQHGRAALGQAAASVLGANVIGTELKLPVALVLIVATLTLKPAGLFGKKVVVRV